MRIELHRRRGGSLDLLFRPLRWRLVPMVLIQEVPLKDVRGRVKKELEALLPAPPHPVAGLPAN